MMYNMDKSRTTSSEEPSIDVPASGFREGLRSTTPDGSQLRRLATGSALLSVLPFLMKSANALLVWIGGIGDGLHYLSAWARSLFGPGHRPAGADGSGTAPVTAKHGHGSSPIVGGGRTFAQPATLGTLAGRLVGTTATVGVIGVAVALPIVVMLKVLPLKAQLPKDGPSMAEASPTTFVARFVEIAPSSTIPPRESMRPELPTSETIILPSPTSGMTVISVTATAAPTASDGVLPTRTPTESPTATSGIAIRTVVATLPPATRQPTSAPTLQQPTDVPTTPPSVTPTSPPPTITPDPRVQVCDSIIHRSVPAEVIEQARYHPDAIGGWDVLCNPNAPSGPFNGRRRSLNLIDGGKPYHPVYNSLIFKCGCN